VILMQRTFFFLCLLAMTGCVSIGNGVHQQRFMLESVPVKRFDKPKIPAILLRPVRVMPAFSGQQFVSRVGQFRYEKDYQKIFMVPLAQQMTQILESSLRASNLAKQVTVYGAGVGRSVMLRSTIEQFYIDKREPERPQVVVRWQIKCYHVHNFSTDLFATMVYSERLPIANNHPLISWNHAVRRIMQRFVVDFAQQIDNHSTGIRQQRVKHQLSHSTPMGKQHV
jgi:uncharacterized lipoprotein YmbA